MKSETLFGMQPKRNAGFVMIATLTALGACASNEKEGSERGPCYGNGSCDDGLVCMSDLCVDPKSLGKATKRERAEAKAARLKAEMNVLETEQMQRSREATALRREMDQLAVEQEQLARDLAAAESDPARDAIRQKLLGKQRELDTLRRAKARAIEKKKAKEREKIKLRCDPSDPLCGI